MSEEPKISVEELADGTVVMDIDYDTDFYYDTETGEVTDDAGLPAWKGKAD